ncbi:unnamed protein product [Nippostrongylus brasiliensis]|uniref:Secreted protein n=1 Tax=Nippostrongylus brasiliensis TaxID=27835 RepID=A0A0N4Y6W8_NIPBR|nr:hypothetical protein Q1695_010458 [Nippostrongylus brasiliensis]VDL75453.1 unnamed protein product [Nippostrongylus brasiliensis]
MKFVAIYFLLTMTALSMADCGCGAKCAIYSDPSKCTRCCTATVKRSLPDPYPPRSHRFLLPPLANAIRVPMWLIASSGDQQPPQPPEPKRHRRHRRPSRHLLHQILTETIVRHQ